MNEIELEGINDVKLMGGVVKTLEKLKRLELKIGIITRSCREYARKIVQKFGLETLIDAVVARDDILKPKPDHEHPQHLMKILGIKPSETILIGDHPMDAVCAKNVGINFFLIRKKTPISRLFRNVATKCSGT